MREIVVLDPLIKTGEGETRLQRATRWSEAEVQPARAVRNYVTYVRT